MENDNKVWQVFRQARDTFLTTVRNLSVNYDMEHILRNSFSNVTDINNILLYLECQLDAGNSGLAHKFTRELAETAIAGSITNIIAARQVLLKMDRAPLAAFLEANMKDIITRHSEMEDEEWLYRRSIELANVLNFIKLKKYLIAQCKLSDKEDVREIAEDFS